MVTTVRRFSGFRVNVESIPRLPVSVASQAIRDRWRQFAFWLDDDSDVFAYLSVVEPTINPSTVRIGWPGPERAELVGVAPERFLGEELNSYTCVRAAAVDAGEPSTHDEDPRRERRRAPGQHTGDWRDGSCSEARPDA